ncbi:MAG: DDE-type integrase/transposase/recombinase [Desulfuromonadaceae bacterium]|nr:DDE-type integrase/transposase/recombinase [Desulfuromonadaceae bacterium]
MEDDIQEERNRAVQRFLRGEKPEAICASLNRSKSWLYKWVERYVADDDSWTESRSCCPHTFASRTSKEVEEIIKMVRLNLYNKGLFCGAQAILWELEDLGITSLPSLRTINRILSRNELTHRRTGKYEPKGTPYPKLPSARPNQTHQVDLVGPCYLKGPLRFYGLNVIDLSTARCGLYPSETKAGQNVIDGLWDVWKRLGIPEHLQMDNAMSFFGSPRHPRGMGQVIRLCLHSGVEPWFIPMAEPWRNGVIEKFNDLYQQKFLDKIMMATADDLKTETLAFEQRHNISYRYSKLGGKTPVKALAATKIKLRFPAKDEAPRQRLKRPETGRYHLVRLIRSNLKLNIGSELFPIAPELKGEYVVATIDVKEQKLKLFLDKTQVDEFDYKLC